MPNPLDAIKNLKTQAEAIRSGSLTQNQLIREQLAQIVVQTGIMEKWEANTRRIAVALEKIAKK